MEIKKLDTRKVFRDPLYGYIEVEYNIISDLIDSKEFQRLRRIKQLSGVSMVFQTAEHSRFTHSLGVYQMANLALKYISFDKEFSFYEKILLLTSALLHDIGHGPYSHAFEAIMDVSHEIMSTRLISSNLTEINKILVSYDKNLVKDICDVLLKKSKYNAVSMLVSSHLDCDRMDYLIRDSYYTGATYGNIDYCRLLDTMVIKDDDLYVKASGVHTLESYLMSRYHMYFQVYYHRQARAFELVLENIYKRIKDLVNENIKVNAFIDSFINVLKDSNNILDYIELDDSYVNGFIKQLVKSDDKILNMLSNSFMQRKLFKCIDLSIDNIDIDLDKYKNSRYFYYEQEVSVFAYLVSKKSLSIKIIHPSGKIFKLEDYSPIIKSLKNSSVKTIKRIYYYDE